MYKALVCAALFFLFGGPAFAAESSSLQEPNPVGLQAGQPAPWNGILVPRTLLEQSMADYTRLQMCDAALVSCRTMVPRVAGDVARACPEPEKPSVWRTVLGLVGASVLTIIVMNAVN